jgi:hypothetical protein
LLLIFAFISYPRHKWKDCRVAASVLSEEGTNAVARREIGHELKILFGRSFITPVNTIHKESFSQSLIFTTGELTHVFYKRSAP